MKAEVYPDHILLIPESPIEAEKIGQAIANGIEVHTRSLGRTCFEGYSNTCESQSISLWFSQNRTGPISRSLTVPPDEIRNDRSYFDRGSKL